MENEGYEQLKWDIISTGKEIIVSDTNLKIKELYGGFGQGQKILTVHQVAQIHADNPEDKKELKEKVKAINKLISNNIILDSGDKYFEFGIDIIDLKQEFSNPLFSNLKNQGIYTQSQIGNASNLYILSEQGYSLLINLMKDTKSKIIYKKVIRDYFRMKELILGLDDAEQYFKRTLGKKERKKTTDTIKYFIDRGDFPWHDPKNPKRNAYAIETNYIYKTLFNMTAKQIEEYFKLELKDYDTVRNYMCYQDLDDIREIEGRVGYMKEDGKSFEQIKQRLRELYPNTRKPKMGDKNISVIKKLMLEG